VATQPDPWDAIVEGGLSREVGGELPADFSARVMQRADLEPAAGRQDRVWVWWTGMGLLAALLVAAHAGLAARDYREAVSSVLEAGRSIRLDLMIAAVLSVAGWEALARALAVRTKG
jgi:hypothetical protein